MVGYEIRMSFSEETAVDETEFSFYYLYSVLLRLLRFPGRRTRPMSVLFEVFNCLAKGMNIRGLKAFI